MMAHKRLSRKPMSLKERGRRGLSLFLSLVMTLSLVQIGAFAGNSGYNSEGQIQKENGEKVYYEYDAAQKKLVLKTDGTQLINQVQNRSSNPEVIVSKDIAGVENGENLFDITLNVETTQPVSMSTQYPDAAVTIVLDVSGSMDYCSVCGSENHRLTYYCDESMEKKWVDEEGGWYDWGDDLCDNCGKTKAAHYTTGSSYVCTNSPTRLQANKTAAKTFLDTFAASATYTDANGQTQMAKRYVSLVTYNTKGYAKTDGWIDVSNSASLTNVKNLIDNLSCNSGTDVAAGLQTAYNNYLFKMPMGSDNKPMSLGNTFVLLLGDGEPDDDDYASAPNDKEYERYNKNGFWGSGYANAEKWARKIRTEGAKILAAYSGTDTNSTGYKWFSSPFTNQCALCTSVDDLKQTFESYITLIRLSTKAWEVHDPMGDNFTYVQSLTPDAHITPNDAKDEITWTLRADEPDVYRDNNGEKGQKITYQQYRSKYIDRHRGPT